MVAHRLSALLGTLLALSATAACTDSSPSGPPPSVSGTNNITGSTGGGVPPVSGTTQRTGEAGVPRPDHVVVVVMENKDAAQVLGSDVTPYIDELGRQGVVFTDSHAITRPSQPNYIALFSGDTHGVDSNDCPQTLDAPNLGRSLLDAGLGFAGYSESLPEAGFTGCISGQYMRKHSPWTNFTNLPSSVNLPFSQFGSDYAKLPEVSFVTPNMCNDMHDCGRAQGDSWLRSNIDGYVQWARSHNSLLVLTWDEADQADDNKIATLFVGSMVRQGQYGGHVDHYKVLRTIEDMYSLPRLGESKNVEPITEVWNTR
jgi:acid phosphatase